MNKFIDHVEESANDCLDRAEVCPCDSEDYFKLLNMAATLTGLSNERKKIEYEHELESKKYEDSKNWKDLKFLLPLILPVCTTVITLVYNRNTLRLQTRDICNFEKTNTFTYSAGKGLSSVFKFPSIINRGA